jgi:hypothetical protein
VHTGIHVFEGDIYKFVDMLEDILRGEKRMTKEDIIRLSAGGWRF